VWQLHKVYSTDETKAWVVKGCTTAAIGCLDCKQPLIEAIVAEQKPWRERAAAYLGRPEAGALDRRGRHRAGADGGAGDDAGRAPGHGARLLASKQDAARSCLLRSFEGPAVPQLARLWCAFALRARACGSARSSGLAAAQLAFGAGQELGDVGGVAPEEQQRHHDDDRGGRLGAPDQSW
jgi:hypothetical protein